MNSVVRVAVVTLLLQDRRLRPGRPHRAAIPTEEISELLGVCRRTAQRDVRRAQEALEFLASLRGLRRAVSGRHDGRYGA